MNKIFTGLIVTVAVIIAFIFNVWASEEKTLILKIDSPTMMVNGAEREIELGKGISPIVKDDRTLVPIRAVLIEDKGDMLYLGWDINKIRKIDWYTDEGWECSVNDLDLNELYITMLFDNNLDNVIDKGELVKIKLNFKTEGGNIVQNYAEQAITENNDQNDALMAILDVINEKCKYGDNLEKLTDSEKIIYLVGELEEEVNNGGFSQFFFNSSGQNADKTIKALKEVGANKTAELLTSALSICKNSSATWKEDGEELTEQQDEELNKLDEQFYKYEDDLLGLQITFIENHIKEFK